MARTSTNYPQPDTSGIEKKLDILQNTLGTQKWWENNWVQGLIILGALAGILAMLLAFFPSASNFANQWPWFAVGASVLLALAGLKIYLEQNKKALIFIPDEMQSFWHHAPQPDGRELTQISLRGYVTNTSRQALFLANIHLISPRTKRTHQRFIFTVHHNAVDSSDRPIMAGERTEFSGHFFADGFLGKPGKPMTIIVSITDNLGKRHKVKFPSLWRAEDR